MILFVFEGGKAEPMLFESIGKLLLSGEDFRIVKCRHDLPTLYRHLKDNDYDLFRSLPFEENGIEIPDGKRLDTLFSQIFLFFDYDFQNKMGLEKVNDILDNMLEFFDDETDNGKLYINYPMVESLKYTKELPDPNYWQYVVTRDDCCNNLFKANAEQFAYTGAKAFKFIDLNKIEKEEIIANWMNLKTQNVAKANYIVSDNNMMPSNLDDINQQSIFDAQKVKYVAVNQSVAILNSFPLFIYEYFGE